MSALCDFSRVLENLDIVCFSAVWCGRFLVEIHLFYTIIVFRIVSQDLTRHGAKN